MLGLFEDALRRKTAGEPFLFGPFTGATPLAARYLQAVLAHEPVRARLDSARALPPRETY